MDRSFGDLRDGSGEWINIQPVVRSTFCKMAETLAAQREALRQQEENNRELHLRLQTKEQELAILERSLASKADKQHVQDLFEERVAAALRESTREREVLAQRMDETFSLLEIRLRSREKQQGDLEELIEQRVDASFVQRLVSQKLREVLPRLDRVERDVVALDTGKVNGEELEESVERVKEDTKVMLDLHVVREGQKVKHELQRRLQELEDVVSSKADQGAVMRLLEGKVDSKDMQERLREMHNQAAEQAGHSEVAMQEAAVQATKLEESVRELRREVDKKADQFLLHQQLSDRDAEIASLRANVESKADAEHVTLQLRKKVDLDAMRDHTAQFSSHDDMQSTVQQMVDIGIKDLTRQLHSLGSKVEELDSGKADRDFVMQELLDTRQGAEKVSANVQLPLKRWFQQRQRLRGRSSGQQQKRRGRSRPKAVSFTEGDTALEMEDLMEEEEEEEEYEEYQEERGGFSSSAASFSFARARRGNGAPLSRSRAQRSRSLADEGHPDEEQALESISAADAMNALFEYVEELGESSAKVLSMEQRVEDSTKNMGSKLRKLQDIVEGLESDMLRKVTLEDLHKVEQNLLSLEEGWHKDSRNISAELKRIQNFENLEDMAHRNSKQLEEMTNRVRSAESEFGLLKHNHTVLSQRVGEVADEVHEVHQNSVVRSELQKMQQRLQDCKEEVTRGHPQLHEVRAFQTRCEESLASLTTRLHTVLSELDKRALASDVQAALDRKMDSRLVNETLDELEAHMNQELQNRVPLFELGEIQKVLDELRTDVHSAKLTIRSLSADGRLDDVLHQVDDLQRRKADKDALDSILESMRQRFVDRSMLSAELNPVFESLHKTRSDTDESLGQKMMEVESNMQKLANSVETVSLSLSKEVKRLNNEKADSVEVDNQIRRKAGMDDVEGMLTDKVGHEELSQWVEQIHKNFREQLVSLPEWDVLERLEAQAKQWATRVFVEESVDRRVTNLQRSFEPLLAGVQTMRRASPMRSSLDAAGEERPGEHSRRGGEDEYESLKRQQRELQRGQSWSSSLLRQHQERRQRSEQQQQDPSLPRRQAAPSSAISPSPALGEPASVSQPRRPGSWRESQF